MKRNIALILQCGIMDINAVKRFVKNELKLGFSQYIVCGKEFAGDALVIYNISFKEAFSLSQKHPEFPIVIFDEKESFESVLKSVPQNITEVIKVIQPSPSAFSGYRFKGVL